MKFRVVTVAVMLAIFSVSTSYAIVGVGAHYGFDFSMSMKNVDKDVLNIPVDGGFTVNGFNLPDGISNVLEGNSGDGFLYVSRADWKNSFINFGGKVFVDIVPYINTLELSCNFGVWQYEGVVHFLDVKKLGAELENGNNPTTYPYDVQPLTLEAFKVSPFLKVLGLTKTPYAKLQLDASVRKDVFALPLDIFKVNAGGGFTLDFTTPILGGHLVDGVQVEKGYSPEQMVEKLSDPNSGVGRQIVEKIWKELVTPRYGMHIVAGAHFKIPAVPIGLYADGKLMIPFTKFDENGDVKGLGVLFNVGAALQF